MEVIVNEKLCKYMLTRPWRGQYIDNCIANGRSPGKILRCLLGGSGSGTLAGSFVWDFTPEGNDLWRDRSIRLGRLYNDNHWDSSCKVIDV